ncbi:calponin homology domain-containing protein DDB_G0272472-like isoform X1 [Palaemon carinicauda]|uniref:calponin homology domain-containing protein DDB_G0272472-like isoform X1 n=1 Tax=Palaemon carinicauda TaxID=392227 RepID=UPI0035B5D82F
MHRNQNRSRSRDNFGNNNRNRQRNNGNRRRDDFDRNSDRFQGGLGRRDGQGGQMSQIDRGSFGMNAAGYSQGMGMYGNPQNQMVGFGGGYGGSGGFQQQNRFGMNPQQMINPWANNMMGGPSSAATGDEAKLAMNILNAVLASSGPQSSGRGMSPPPNKMRRMDFRDGGYDDRRRRARSPPGRSHQNRQQSSQRGSDRRGRDGHSSSQRNDDHRFRNSLSKSPGVSKSSRQSSVDENSEFVFRKRLTFEERERETKKKVHCAAKGCSATFLDPVGHDVCRSHAHCAISFVRETSQPAYKVWFPEACTLCYELSSILLDDEADEDSLQTAKTSLRTWVSGFGRNAPTGCLYVLDTDMASRLFPGSSSAAVPLEQAAPIIEGIRAALPLEKEHQLSGDISTLDIHTEPMDEQYKDLPLKALKCHMCEKTIFHNVTAYLAHVDSKGHNKVARAYHEKIAASANLIKQTARLALQKEMKKAKAQGIKVVEKECRVCEGPMVYGNLKHKNILACKILHKYHNQTVCCGKDHKTKSLLEEHCLSLAHLQATYESEDHDEEIDATEGEKGTTGDELAEDEEESQKRLKRDVARRKRKFGDDETDEEEEEEDEEEKITSDHQEEKQEADENKAEEEKEKSEQVNGNDTEEKENEVEQMESEVKEEENEDEKKEPESKEEQMEVDVKKDDNEKVADETNIEIDNQEETKVKEEKNNNENDNKKNRAGNQKRDNNKAKLKKEKDNKYQGKTLPQLTFLELLEFHKKNAVDDPEQLTGYDPAQPTGLNYIDTRVSYHCMACLEYCPAFPEDLKTHSCSKEHYDLFRSKYMKVKGVRDSPTSLKRLKNLGKKKEENKDEKEENKDSKKKEDTNDPEDEGGNKSEKNVDEKAGSSDKATTHENEEVGGDDALYDPYEGESGDLTTMLQEKKATDKQEAESAASYEVNDEAHESEAENYEDNILDYEEDVVEDEDKEEKYQGEEKEGNQGENEEYDENEECQDDENNEGDNENTNEEVNENEEECENDEEEGNEDEEYENENQEFEDNEGYAEQIEDEEEQQEEEEEAEEEEEEEEEEEDVEEVPQPPARRGRSRRAF